LHDASNRQVGQNSFYLVNWWSGRGKWKLAINVVAIISTIASALAGGRAEKGDGLSTHQTGLRRETP
jgi:hypothetical protein